jgi:hypothetical protein
VSETALIEFKVLVRSPLFARVRACAKSRSVGIRYWTITLTHCPLETDVSSRESFVGPAAHAMLAPRTNPAKARYREIEVTFVTRCIKPISSRNSTMRAPIQLQPHRQCQRESPGFKTIGLRSASQRLPGTIWRLARGAGQFVLWPPDGSRSELGEAARTRRRKHNQGAAAFDRSAHFALHQRLGDERVSSKGRTR